MWCTQSCCLHIVLVTEMEMAPFFTIDPSVAARIKLDEAPVSGDDYLHQVAIDRQRQPEIVVADKIPTTKRYNRTATAQKVSPVVVKRENEESSASKKPPVEWQERQLADFSELRARVDRCRQQLVECDGLPKVAFPAASNGPVWKTFCLQCRSTLFTPVLQQQPTTGEEDVTEEFTNPPDSHVLTAADVPKSERNENGTPPYLRLILALSQPLAVDLLSYHIEWLAEDLGDGKDLTPLRAQWLFALMSVLEKPLCPSTCAVLRDLARFCIGKREKCDEEGLIRAYSWFICVVGKYFHQGDLAD